MPIVMPIGKVPQMLQRVLIHCSSMANAAITANVMAATMMPSTVRMPAFYHGTVSGFRKKD
jgi:hypothetical protein